MNKYILIIAATFICLFLACKVAGQLVNNQKFDDKVGSLLSYSVPVISVDDLRRLSDEVVILDTREKVEYEMSHIPGAIYVGYDDFDIKKIKELDTTKSIVVYCSIGYRSEKIGEQLQNAGYDNVSNLYGSIFEWVNRGFPIVDGKGDPTNKIHCYNKKWSKWVLNSDYKKEW